MKRVTRDKWKRFKSVARKVHSRRIEGYCGSECEHLLERAQDVMERSGYESARKHFDKHDRCVRSCYIRKSDTAYSRAGKRWAKMR